MKKIKTPIILIGLAVVIALWTISVYNNLVKTDEGCTQQWSKVESQYQRRLDLIPNLVSTVKGYASHEKETLMEVIEARNQAVQNKVDTQSPTQGDINKFQQSQDQLSSALGKLMVVVERYPDLKANQNFLDLQQQLEGTENRIAVERQRFADVVSKFNQSIRRFPNSMIAGLFGFERKEYFVAQSGAENAPEVTF